MSNYANTSLAVATTGSARNFQSLFRDASGSQDISHYQGTRLINTRTEYANAFSGRARGRTATPVRDALTLTRAAPTPTVDDAVAMETVEESAHVVPQDEVKRVARERVLLMAKLYAKAPGETETASRLEMLNARLLRIAPRVSPQQVAVLANIAEQLEKDVAARNARALAREERRAKHKAATAHV